ncbi:MAG: hypothetical protein HYZ60_02815, partial [Methylocystis sp.]|nr:hypothetical protein [Methylocystis sp.]
MKKIAIVTAIFVATAAKAEVITKDEALSFGYEIVVWAACGQRFATLDLAKFLNKGAKLKDFEALRAEILHGKELAKESLAQKGKPAFCGKDDSTSRAIRDHASDAETLGFVSVEDELCGTHSYKAMIE